MISQFLGEQPYISGENLTFADFFIYEQVLMFNYFCKNEIIKKHPNLKIHSERIAELPGLKEYLASDRCIKRPFNGKRAKINNWYYNFFNLIQLNPFLKFKYHVITVGLFIPVNNWMLPALNALWVID